MNFDLCVKLIIKAGATAVAAAMAHFLGIPARARAFLSYLDFIRSIEGESIPSGSPLLMTVARQKSWLSCSV